jgi:biotin synthase-related radical SAM superfamily protein
MVQERYCYTDEYILSIPYARFMDMVATISQIKAEELREQYRQAAFAAYLNGAGSSEDESLSFQEYLKKIGLDGQSNNEEEAPQEENVTKEEAIARAEKILATVQWQEG